MVKYMFSRLKDWLLGLFVAVAFALTIIGAFGQCSKPVGSPVTKQVDTLIQIRHDTFQKLDTVLSYKIKRIETVRIDTVEAEFDSAYADTTHDTVYISSNQLRESVKCIDSLANLKQKIAIDDMTIAKIDTVVHRDTIKEKPPITQRLKDAGLGALFGIAIRSFF